MGDSQIDVIQFEDGSGNVVKSFAAPFKIKAGSNLTFSVVGNALVITGAAGGITDHALLTDLDYPHAGHTGLVPYANLPWDNTFKNFLPSSLLGLVLWLKSDTGVTKDSSNRISKWADQSGIGNDWNQAVTANMPTWVANQINGYPAINFDPSSADQFLHCESMGAYWGGYNKPYTLFIVLKPAVDNSMNIISVNGGGSPMQEVIKHHSGFLNQTELDIGSGTLIGQFTSRDLTRPMIVCIHTDDNAAVLSMRESGRIWVDRTNWNLGNANFNADYAAMGHGIWGGYAGSQLPYSGQILEIILTNIPIAEPMLSIVEQYLCYKYGIVSINGAPATFPTLTQTTKTLYGGNVSYTLTDTDFLAQVDTSSGNFSVAFPQLAYPYTGLGKVYVITKTDDSANTITLTGAPGDGAAGYFNGAATYVLAKQWETAIVMGSNGAGWIILAANNH